ncbi:MAG TPA: RHS repeat-associated core domain-containing protein [Fimbriimonadaceae bacterium]|nr:RHS repeat-associated core domain-containing protein [Fimbriimonadaceae bacterium]
MSVRVTTVNGRIVGEKRNGQHRVLIPDPQGNVIKVRDGSGTLLASYNYWPYGGLRTSTGSIVNPWRYSGTWGAYFDGERYYIRARDYRPDLTRWMTVDHWVFSANPYLYCESNPATRFDPSGKESLHAVGYVNEHNSDFVSWAYTSCGVSMSFIQWRGWKTPVRQGWIIQKVEVIQTRFDCCTDKPATQTETYFEAWCIAPTKTGGSVKLFAGDCVRFRDMPKDITYDAHDRWIIGPRGFAGPLGRWGSITIKAWAYIVDGTPKDFFTHFRKGGHPAAGDLLSTKSYPGWNQGRARLVQSLDHYWDCCSQPCTKNKPIRVPEPPKPWYFYDDCYA